MSEALHVAQRKQLLDTSHLENGSDASHHFMFRSARVPADPRRYHFKDVKHVQSAFAYLQPACNVRTGQRVMRLRMEVTEDTSNATRCPRDALAGHELHATLKHPAVLNLNRILIEAPFERGQARYVGIQLITDLLQGTSLLKWVLARDYLSHESLLSIVGQINGLTRWLHRMGIILRDFHPANFALLDENEGENGSEENAIETAARYRVKLVSMKYAIKLPGVAEGQAARRLGVYGLAGTSLSFMSADMVAGRAYSRCHDVFSLSSLIFFLCTKRFLLCGSVEMQKAQLLTEPIRPYVGRTPDNCYSPEVEQIMAEHGDLTKWLCTNVNIPPGSIRGWVTLLSQGLSPSSQRPNIEYLHHPDVCSQEFDRVYLNESVENIGQSCREKALKLKWSQPLGSVTFSSVMTESIYADPINEEGGTRRETIASLLGFPEIVKRKGTPCMLDEIPDSYLIKKKKTASYLDWKTNWERLLDSESGEVLEAFSTYWRSCLIRKKILENICAKIANHRICHMEKLFMAFAGYRNNISDIGARSRSSFRDESDAGSNRHSNSWTKPDCRTFYQHCGPSFYFDWRIVRHMVVAQNVGINALSPAELTDLMSDWVAAGGVSFTKFLAVFLGSTLLPMTPDDVVKGLEDLEIDDCGLVGLNVLEGTKMKTDQRSIIANAFGGIHDAELDSVSLYPSKFPSSGFLCHMKDTFKCFEGAVYKVSDLTNMTSSYPQQPSQNNEAARKLESIVRTAVVEAGRLDADGRMICITALRDLVLIEPSSECRYGLNAEETGKPVTPKLRLGRSRKQAS